MSHINEAPLRFTTNDTHSANATYQAEFATPVGDSNTNKGIGKADRYKGEMDPNNNQYMGLSDKSLRDDESVARDLNLITRSVASSQLSQSLGLKSVVAEAYAASPDGKQVGISAMASGSQLMSNVTDHEGLGPAVIHREFDFSRHDIQKGLYDLEAVDYLSGQIDRHAGNIFINIDTGEVEGIDNDLCFGEKPLEVAVRDMAIAAKAVGTPPLFYHEDTAAAIEKMDPAEMAKMLASVSSPDGGHRLTEPEIGAAVERLKTLKASVQVARMEGRVMSKFDEKTLQKAVAHQEKFGGSVAGYEDACCASYVGRSELQLQRARELSQNPANGNVVLKPSGARPLTPYENQLAAHNNEVKKAHATALGDPSHELRDALGESQAALNELKELDAQVVEKLKGNASLQSNRKLADDAMKARMANIDKLKACGAHREVGGSSQDGLKPEQAQLINTMVPGVNVEEGDRLNPQEWNAIEGRAKILTRTYATDARLRELTNQNTYVNSAEKVLGIEDQKHVALARLAVANAKVNLLVQQDPRVKQAVAEKQQYVEASKPGLAQANLERANERVMAAENALDAARAADEAAWFEGQGKGTKEELEALGKNLDAAETELAAARQAQQQAADKVQAMQAPAPQVARVAPAPPAGQVRLKDVVGKLPPPPSPPGAPGSQQAGDLSSDSVADSLKKQAAGRRPAPQRSGPKLSELAQSLPPPPSPPKLSEESKENSVGAKAGITWKKPTVGPKEGKGVQIGSSSPPSPRING